LTYINTVSSQGDGPAHVSVDATGSWLMAANYGSGHATTTAITSDGTLDDTVISIRLAGENAHQIRQDPATGVVYVPCLGSEYVTFFGFDPADGVLDPPPPDAELDLPAGSGPRHMDFHPTLPIAYVINEHGDSIVVATRETSGPLTAIQTVPTLPDDGFDPNENFCADIHVTPDGRFVYGSNRGHNTLAIFGVDASTGMLTPIGHEPTGGDWPRNFSIDPAGEILLVANQQSDLIQTFRIDPMTGLLTPLIATPTSGSPAFVGVFTQPLR
jgi:6-phosphogluconolactonase